MTEHQDISLIDESLLPPVARRLVKVIGMAETIALLKVRGGTQTRIPLRGQQCDVLGDILNPESLSRLAGSELAGNRLDLPKADKALQQLRDMAIAEARRHNSAPEVARMYNLSRRRIIMISNQNQQDDKPQGDLFTCDPTE